MSRKLGTTAWLDYAATNAEAAKEFYTQLFGWDFEDTGEEFGHYNIVRKDDGLVGGFMDVAGIPDSDGKPMSAHWGVFLAADDAEAVAQAAVENGGAVFFPASEGEVGSAGRFAVLADADRNQVGVWQAGDTEGYDFTGQPGTPVWFEIMTNNIDKQIEFYTNTFGANLVPMGTPMEDQTIRYYTNGAEAEASWGMGTASMLAEGMSAGWRIYFGVESSEAAVARVKELGGKVLDGPFPSPFGAIATIADPCGATFQICAMSEAQAE